MIIFISIAIFRHSYTILLVFYLSGNIDERDKTVFDETITNIYAFYLTKNKNSTLFFAENMIFGEILSQVV